MPTGRNKPSFFRMPKERLNLEWYRIKSRAKDLVRYTGRLFFTGDSRLDVLK